MRILLATSPHVRHVAVLQGDYQPRADAMYTFAPVGLLTLVAVLRRERPSIDVDLYDLNRRIISGAFPLDHGFYSAIASDIAALAPDVIGFMTECDSYHHVIQVAEELKRMSPRVKIVLGGPHASAVGRQTMARVPAIDAIVVGEGEQSFPLLLDEIERGTGAPVAGTLRRVSRQSRPTVGEVVDGGPAPLVDSLDELPVPAYDLYPAAPDEEMFVEVGRGCPFQCTFCSTAPYWSRRHRVKSPGRIRAEIAYVQALYGTRRAHFTHDLFTTDKRWVRAVCAELIEAGTPIRWTCSARTDTVDRELLDLMARAGCDAIYFGIESGSQRVLRDIHKDIPLDHSLIVLEDCQNAGITPNAGFIVGLPSDDATSIGETFAAYERALRIGTRPTHLFGYCPFAGSAVYTTLSDLHCDGHFVDLPLGENVDYANRSRIAADRDLYGAYYRTALGEVVPGARHAVSAMDEFSPLVEAALYPTLALAGQIGGMHELFVRWLAWITAYNEGRGAPTYRRGYGSPALFARFVLDKLSSFSAASAPALAAARAIALHLEVAEMWRPARSTTMDSHRSLPLPAFDGEGLSLSSTVSRGGVVAMLSVQFDVTAVLRGATEDPPARRTNLVWQAAADASVRLVGVTDDIFESLVTLDHGPMTIGEILLERAKAEHVSVGPNLDAGAAIASIAEAAREGLVTTQGSR